MAAVHAKDLFFLYRAHHGDVAALRGLNLDVGEGEAVSVLGPSGAGKTTLLNLCAGWLRPSSGELSVLGLEVERSSPGRLGELRRTSIGVVRQHYHRALPRELTAEEIVSLPLRLLGGRESSARKRAHALLRDAGLGRRAGAYPPELSGGEQQRVAIARALVREPRVILADEPTGNLDERTRDEIIGLLEDLWTVRRLTVVIVTHDSSIAARAPRRAWIAQGRLSVKESPDLITASEEA